MLGVLPQAIKLFCVRGIPVTQAIAAILLATSIPGLARTIRYGQSHQAVKSISEGLEQRRQLGIRVHRLIFCGAIAPHLALLAYVWNDKKLDEIQYPVPQDL